MYYSSDACSIFICFIVLIYLFPILLGAHGRSAAWRICGQAQRDARQGVTLLFLFVVILYSLSGLYSHSFGLF